MLEKEIGSKKRIAYFCTEYGFTNELRIYSGGLGILAGDHLKEASDQGIPLVAVGLLYRHGYFRQRIAADGSQIALFEDIVIPSWVERVTENGQPVKIEILIGEESIVAEIYKCNVGSVPLYLLSTDIPENTPQIRSITSKLYCADRKERLQQEILLGVGGWKALRRLGIEPDFLHINEGHSVFSALEWIHQIMHTKVLSFEEALSYVRPRILFTTHTPVPAGNEKFNTDLAKELLEPLSLQLGIRINKLLSLGKTADSEDFCLSAVALRIAGYANGVSRIHEGVSRKMWQDIWPEVKSVIDVPIGHVTNGVHYSSWISPDLGNLYRQSVGADIGNLDNKEIWKKESILDEKLWFTHQKVKKQMLTEIHERLLSWRQRDDLPLAETNFPIPDPNILTIGFARRFAPYKRALMIFNDLDRLDSILNSKERPVQIIFAGKAHPADLEGQKLIKKIVEYSLIKRFSGKIFFVEGYNIKLATALVQGCDVWLNLPTPPLEASGTSGEKAAINGVLNLSVLDGWWAEAFDGSNGWGIEEVVGAKEKDAAKVVYDIIENQVAPLYYDRDQNNIPVKWVGMMKNSICSIIPQFTTRRMLKEYWSKYYSSILSLREV